MKQFPSLVHHPECRTRRRRSFLPWLPTYLSLYLPTCVFTYL